MISLGHTALGIALFASAYAMAVDLLGAWRRDEALMKSARNATWASLLCLTTAAVALMTLLLKSDFSVFYVAGFTSRNLPLAYKISAFWAGASGSLLLWLWIQVGFVVLAFGRLRQNHWAFCANARAIGNFVSVFFLLVLIFDKNPFAVSLVSPEDGEGLNPLLQHPAMAMHPPTLFLGYAAFVVPFAWGFASLKCHSGTNASPLYTYARNGIMGAWMFLTIGILLGAWWAYEELGWGGYWAWDPVENSSLMPWLTATALLHCSRNYQRNNRFAVWVIVLSLLTFSLCIFGTFLTRYGLVSSVHAFPEPGLGILFMVLLAHLWAIALFLIIRAYTGKNKLAAASGFAGYRFIAWTNWLLILLTLVIFAGTLFPFFSDLVSSPKISLKPDYFTKITAPGGMALLLLLGICPHLIRFGFSKNWRFLGALGVALAAIACWRITDSLAWPCLILCAYAGLNLLVDFVLRYRRHIKTESLDIGGSGNLRWCGARFVHLGIVLIFMGIAGSGGFAVEKQVALRPNDVAAIAGFTLRYHDLKANHGPNYTAVTADISVFKSIPSTELQESQTEIANQSDTNDSPVSSDPKNSPIAHLAPSLAVYSGSEKRTSEVDIRRTLAGDLYLALTQVNSRDKLINLSILVKPLINWIWIGGILSVIGAIIVQISFYRKNKTPVNVQNEVV